MKATPRFLAEIRGSTKDLTFKTMPDGSIIASRTRPIPTDHRTESQDAVRLAFTQAKNEWNALAQNEKDTYSTQAAPLGITGYNLYLSTRITELLEAPASLDMDFSTDPGIYGSSLPTNNYYEWDETNENIKYRFRRYGGKSYHRKFIDLSSHFSLPFQFSLDITVTENYAPDRYGSLNLIGITDTNNNPDNTRTYYNKTAGLYISDDQDHGASNFKGVAGLCHAQPNDIALGDPDFILPVGVTKTITVTVTSTLISAEMDSISSSLDIAGRSPPPSTKHLLYLHQNNDTSLSYQKGTIDNLVIDTA